MGSRGQWHLQSSSTNHESTLRSSFRFAKRGNDDWDTPYNPNDDVSGPDEGGGDTVPPPNNDDDY